MWVLDKFQFSKFSVSAILHVWNIVCGTFLTNFIVLSQSRTMFGNLNPYERFGNGKSQIDNFGDIWESVVFW